MAGVPASGPEQGSYLPRPARRVDIPKPSGGVPTRGIPTVVDRLIQQALHQALHQVLQPLFEPTFSEGSFGFRRGRNAPQSVQQAHSYIRDPKRWVVDLDLEKFFDRVNRDVLMVRVAQRVRDVRVLKLIRRFLMAGMMRKGVIEARTEGTPQGGPLSPLLSDILLTDLDRELESRRLAFCRYADNCDIYVGRRVAGERVMRRIRVFLEEALRLRVNTAKSAVARLWQRKFLGYSVTAHRQSLLRIAPESVRRLMQKIHEQQLRQGRGRLLAHTIGTLNSLLPGWITYYQLTESRGVLEKIDGWVRCRLRCLLWRQWKRPTTRVRKLLTLGLDAERAGISAGNDRGSWWNSGARHMHTAVPAATLPHRRMRNRTSGAVGGRRA